MKNFNQALLYSFLISLTYCSAANLKPVNPNETNADKQVKAFIQQANIDCKNQDFIITGADQWNSTIPYWFTPLEDKTAQYKITKSKTLSFTSKDLNIQVSEETANLDRIYVESLAMYSHILLKLCTAEEPVSFDQDSFAKLDREALFFQAIQGQSKDDYIVFTENGRPAAVNFTYRDLSDSYTGYLKLTEWKSVAGRRLPTKIEILDSLADEESVHTVTVYDLK